MSIFQRGTGLAMYFGTLLIVLWLGATALGDGPLGVVNAIFGFWLVQVVLFLATWALLHHMLGGIRYLIWDTTNLMDPAGRELIVRLQLAGGIILTIVAWGLWVWLK
jgi:succinate dehydrogenase / fumarate reductase cytochrome b subunit